MPQLWAGLINESFQLLNFISRSTPAPGLPQYVEIYDPELKAPSPTINAPEGEIVAKLIEVEDDAIPLLNVIRLKRDQRLLISADVRVDLGLKKGDLKDISIFLKAQREQRELVQGEFDRQMKIMTEEGESVLAIWSVEAVDRLESAYQKHIKSKMGRFGRVSDPAWKKAMAAYKNEIQTSVIEYWTAELKVLRQRPTKDMNPTQLTLRKTLQSAIVKLRYVLTLMDTNVVFNLPLPSPTYLEDSLKHLERYTLTFRWVSLKTLR